MLGRKERGGDGEREDLKGKTKFLPQRCDKTIFFDFKHIVQKAI